MKTKLTTETLKSLKKEIGNHWTKKGDRYYLSDEFKLDVLSLEYDRYKTGNINVAYVNGEKISNYECRRILRETEQVWVNLENGDLIGCSERFEEQFVEAINSLIV